MEVALIGAYHSTMSDDTTDLGIAAWFSPANRVAECTMPERAVGLSTFSRMLSMLAPGAGKSVLLTNSTKDLAQLIVRDLSEDLVKALKQRAAKRNRSMEQEHREILQSVLRSPKRRHLATFLQRFPMSARRVISGVSRATNGVDMYLADTDVISEIRKGDKANPGVRAFLADTSRGWVDLYLSVVTIGELRRGVERIRYRGDDAQARRLGRWLKTGDDDLCRADFTLRRGDCTRVGTTAGT